MTKQQVKSDLQDIRYYYTHKSMFDKAEDTGFKSEVKQKLAEYAAYISRASPRLYTLFYALYVEGKTQLAVSMEWNVTEGYIKNLNRQLRLFLLEEIKKEEKDNESR